MLTPKFEVTQDADNVLLRVYTPYIRARDVETAIADNEFRLLAKPYFLRLHFPGPLAEDEREAAQYDIGTGWMSITLPKLTPGENFDGLDMLSRLLAPAQPLESRVAGSAVVELIGGESRPSDHASMDDIDWSLEQRLNLDDDDDATVLTGAKYGFNRQYSGAFAPLGEARHQVVDLDVDPDRASESERRANRIMREDEKFDEDHYIADSVDLEPIQGPLAYKTFWAKQLEKRVAATAAVVEKEEPSDDPADPADLLRAIEANTAEEPPKETNEAEAPAQPLDTESISAFSDAEQKLLRELPRKQFLIDDPRPLYLGLVDILFAYSYNLRSTEGESTVESAWTLCRLSATLSCLEVFPSVKDVLVACYRRSLAYPLFRNWELSRAVHADVVVLLRLGRAAVLRALLAVKHAVEMDDAMHIVARLYLTDYCVWVQYASEASLASLADAVEACKVEREDTEWPLKELEELAQEEEDE